MTDYTLGQRVKYSDRLARVNIHTPYGGGYSLERSEELLQSALDLMGISRSRGGTTFRDLDWRLWVPESFAREHLHSGLTMLKYTSTPAAGEGVIVQRATLQQGGTYWDGDEGRLWLDHGTTRAYKVAFDINRTPVHVLPGHLTALDVVDDDEPTHEGWDPEHFRVAGCDGSLHPGDCLGNTPERTSAS